jgi:uncharacterized protein YndB with AHSA1/START domain
MPYSYTLTTVVPADPQDIFDAWLDSAGHSDMTGGKASMSPDIGAEVTAWDGYITGRNLELVPGERIVQSWRTTNFTGDHEDSIVTVTLERTEEGTLLTLEHSNVPDGQTSYEEGGWHTHYFQPMQEYFAKRQQAAPRRPRKAARKTSAAAKKRPAKRASKKAGAKKTAAGKTAARKAARKATKKRAAPKKKAASRPRGAAGKATAGRGRAATKKAARKKARK